MSQSRILVVDDEPLNVEILTEALEGAGYDVDVAVDGVAGWECLEADPTRYDAVLLDRMMPRMGGMMLLEKMKKVPAMAIMPVIMQTARATKEDILEGLKAGAHYYLAKPFDDETLLTVVATAVGDFRRYRDVSDRSAATNRTLLMLDNGTFKFRTLNEARELAAVLSNTYSGLPHLAVALLELFVNAVEHGNLGLTYTEKTALITQGEWPEEIERRLELPQYVNKFVVVEFIRYPDRLAFTVRDEGKGFDWEKFMQLDTERAFDNHGRGLAMARMLCFKTLEYLGCGNEVRASVELSTPE